MALSACRECHGQVSAEAAACPHCGAPHPVQAPDEPATPIIDIRPPRRPRIRSSYVALLAMAGLVMVGILWGQQPATTTSRATPGPDPTRRNLASLIGKDCALIDMAPLARDAATAYELVLSLATKDAGNGIALIASGQVVPIVGGGPARVLDSDGTKDALRIRMIAGKSLGREGWVYQGMCR